jgi:hypothetical protein
MMVHGPKTIPYTLTSLWKYKQRRESSWKQAPEQKAKKKKIGVFVPRSFLTSDASPGAQ